MISSISATGTEWSVFAFPGRVVGLHVMAIRRLLKGTDFDLQTAALLEAAYDHCLKRLQIRDRDDPITEFLASKIIDTARTGERDPVQLCQKALQAIAG